MEHILLLHGAIGAGAQLNDLAKGLNDKYHVSVIDFIGHGSKKMNSKPYSIPLFASDVLTFMQERKLEKISIFGYSMGGYVAAYFASRYPEKVNNIITLAAKFHWDEQVAAKEIQMLNADKITEKLPAFAKVLQDRHTANDWKEVLKKTVDMLLELGKNNTLKDTDYTGIAARALLLLGDRDKMVSIDETLSVYKALPNAQMCMLPGTPHPIEQVDVQMLSYVIDRFMTNTN